MLSTEGLIGVNIWRNSKHFDDEFSVSHFEKGGIPASGKIGDFNYVIAIPYASYPIKTLRINDGLIIIEGLICKDPSIAKSVESLCHELLDGQLSDDGFAIKVSERLNSHATFNVYLITDQKCIVVPDAFCRLPLYYSGNIEMAFVGRSITLARELLSPAPDSLGMLGYLWAGYPLGKRTLFEGIYRVESGTAVYLSRSFCKAEKVRGAKGLSDVEIGSQLIPKRDENTTVQAVVERFKKALENTCFDADAGYHLMLSGGLDSRAVLGAMAARRMNYSSSSYDESGNNRDAKVAALLAEKLSVPWQKFNIPQSDFEKEKKQLLNIKQGLNYLGMAFILPYLKYLEGKNVLTGDGGDKVFPYLGDHVNYESKHQLAEVLVQRHAIFSPDLLTKTLGFAKDELRQLIYTEIAAQDEDNLSNAAIRFVLKQRAFKAYFEGEDRNRFYCWSTSPFYDPDFFYFMMSLPKEMKLHGRLYPKFLAGLDKRLLQIPLPNGVRIGSPVYHLQHFTMERVRTKFKLKEMIKGGLTWFGNNHQSADGRIEVRSSSSMLQAFTETNWRAISSEAKLHIATLDQVFG